MITYRSTGRSRNLFFCINLCLNDTLFLRRRNSPKRQGSRPRRGKKEMPTKRPVARTTSLENERGKQTTTLVFLETKMQLRMMLLCLGNCRTLSARLKEKRAAAWLANSSRPRRARPPPRIPRQDCSPSTSRRKKLRGVEMLPSLYLPMRVLTQRLFHQNSLTSLQISPPIFKRNHSTC